MDRPLASTECDEGETRTLSRCVMTRYLAKDRMTTGIIDDFLGFVVAVVAFGLRHGLVWTRLALNFLYS